MRVAAFANSTHRARVRLPFLTLLAPYPLPAAGAASQRLDQFKVPVEVQ